MPFQEKMKTWTAPKAEELYNRTFIGNDPSTQNKRDELKYRLIPWTANYIL